MLLLVQVILLQSLSPSHRLELVTGKLRLNGGDTGKTSETLQVVGLTKRSYDLPDIHIF